MSTPIPRQSPCGTFLEANTYPERLDPLDTLPHGALTDEPGDHVDDVLAHQRDPRAVHCKGKTSATARQERCSGVDSEP